MARTTAEIKLEITTSFMNNGILSSLYNFQIGALFQDTFSNVAIESILFDIVAKLFDITVVFLDTTAKLIG